MKIIHRLYNILLALTLVLIGAGGLVTSTDSGLAVPDWPLSYGTLNPPMVGGVVYEHSHRVIAGCIGIYTLMVCLTVLLRRKILPKSVSVLALLSVVMIAVQALLGGATVLLKLPDIVSIAHATLGQLFFSLIAVLSCLTSDRWGDHFGYRKKATSMTGILPMMFLIQLAIGALLRHSQGETGLVAHIMGAVLVLVASFFTMMQLKTFKKDPFVRILSAVLAHGLMLQIALGIFSYVVLYTEILNLKLFKVAAPTVHQSFGAVLLAVSFCLFMRSRHINSNTDA